MLSAQPLTMPSAYALLPRESVSTKVPYIALMVTLALAGIPGSILNASIPIAARRGWVPLLRGLAEPSRGYPLRCPSRSGARRLAGAREPPG